MSWNFNTKAFYYIFAIKDLKQGRKQLTVKYPNIPKECTKWIESVTRDARVRTSVDADKSIQYIGEVHSISIMNSA
jgi:hypothetical protein